MSKKSQRKIFKHHHQQRLLDMVQRGEILSTPGTVSAINIFHDDWCALLAGTGVCNCDPEVKIAWVQHPGANN